MPFKEGQEVLIKNPHSIVGVIVRERPGDRDLPQEERRYIVHIPEQDRDLIYSPTDLEAIEQPQAQSPSTKPTPYSPAWTTQVEKFIVAGQRWMANNDDHDAMKEFVEAGRKLNFIVPISKSQQE